MAETHPPPEIPASRKAIGWGGITRRSGPAAFRRRPGGTDPRALTPDGSAVAGRGQAAAPALRNIRMLEISSQMANTRNPMKEIGWGITRMRAAA